MERDGDVMKELSEPETVIRVLDASVVYRDYESSSKSIKTNLLSRKLDKSKSKTAIKDINLEIVKGEIVGIIGRNGSGKSTFAKLLMGIVHPSKGNVVVKGTVAGLMSLGAGLNLDWSARENLKFVHLIKMQKKENFVEIENDVINWSDLHLAMDKPLRTFSSGMLARFAFAVETAYKPDILVIDEVLSVGDFEFQKKSGLRMAKIIKSGVTVIFVSHDMASVEEFCTKCVWIDKGEIKLVGSAKKVISEYLKSSS